MLDLTPLNGAGAVAVFVTGVTGSPHCALMCGPLACAQLPGAGSAGRGRALIGWHLGRLVAYGLVGAALGAVGQGIAGLLATRVQPLLPWVMAAGLVLSAFDLGRRLPAAAGLGGLTRGIARLGARLGAFGRAAALGAATPFLPCGLLWGIFLVAVGTGSALGGVLVMTSFGLGAVALLAAVQLGTAWSGRWPRAERVLRVAVPLIAAAALVVRALRAPAGGMHHHPVP